MTMVQLAAVTARLFSWVPPGPPRPVPPVYQPQFSARGHLHTPKDPRRRQYWIGAATLIADSMTPGLLCRYPGAAGTTVAGAAWRRRAGSAK